MKLDSGEDHLQDVKQGVRSNSGDISKDFGTVVVSTFARLLHQHLHSINASIFSANTAYNFSVLRRRVYFCPR